MNKVILMGRLTRDPEVRYSQAAEPIAVARFNLAIDRPRREGQEALADFPSCVALGKQGEWAEKYLRKGMKILVEGRIQTGSYTDSNGNKVYTTEVLVSNAEFCESKQGMSEADKDARDQASLGGQTDSEGFMSIPDGIEEELPFN